MFSCHKNKRTYFGDYYFRIVPYGSAFLLAVRYNHLLVGVISVREPPLHSHEDGWPPHRPRKGNCMHSWLHRPRKGNCMHSWLHLLGGQCSQNDAAAITEGIDTFFVCLVVFDSIGESISGLQNDPFSFVNLTRHLN